MKKIVMILLLASSMLAFAQDKPAATREPTVAELRLQIAQKDVQIAQLKLQLIQASAQVSYRQVQDELATAQKAVQDASLKPSETPKK